MVKKFLKCRKCRYAFFLRESIDTERTVCPYCGKIGSKEEYEEMAPEEYGNGYKISLDEFNYVLRDASKYMIRAFFRKNIDIYSVEISKNGYTFRDKDSNERTVEEVHFLIQTNIVLQRKFYDIYSDLYK